MKSIFAGVCASLTIITLSAAPCEARSSGSESKAREQEMEKQMCVDMVDAKKLKGSQADAEVRKCVADPTVYK